MRRYRRHVHKRTYGKNAMERFFFQFTEDRSTDSGAVTQVPSVRLCYNGVLQVMRFHDDKKRITKQPSTEMPAKRNSTFWKFLRNTKNQAALSRGMCVNMCKGALDSQQFTQHVN